MMNTPLFRASIARCRTVVQPFVLCRRLADKLHSNWQIGAIATPKKPLLQIFSIGSVSGLVLGYCNIRCERYADEHPDSLLARDVGDGIGWRFANYVVPLGVTSGGFIFWFMTQCTMFGRCGLWWFGSQPHWFATLLAGLTIGHYTQEVFANKWSGEALVAHHFGAVAHAVCLVHVNAWRGLLIGWSAIYEAGSVLLNFGYIGLIPQSLGHAMAAGTTIAGMGLGLHSLIRHRPDFGLNVPARLCITALLCIGAGRIQVARANLSSLAACSDTKEM